MKYISLFKKLTYLFNIIKTSPMYITAIILLVATLFLYSIKKIDKKKRNIILLLIYIIPFIIIILRNHKNAYKLFDNISTHFFKEIYFPSIYMYLFAILTLNLSTIKSITTKNTEKIYKRINIIFSFIINFFILIITELIIKNNIDIFSKASLFSNKKVLSIIELNISIYILWILIKSTVFVINYIEERIKVKEENTIEELIPEYETIDKNVEKTEEDTYIEEKPINNDVFSFNDMIKQSMEDTIEDEIQDITKKEVQEEIPATNFLDLVINNTMPLVTEKEEETYTLNDDKTFNNMLKEIKLYNLSNNVTIDKNMELRLLNKFGNEDYSLFKRMLKSYSN